MTSVLNTADTYSDQTSPDANFAQSARLGLSASSGAVRRSYVYFAPPFPVAATVLSATLKVYLNGSWSAQTLTVERITDEWAEDGLTYNNVPAIGATHSASASVSGSDGTEVAIDLSPMLADVAAGALWTGVRLRTSGTSGVWLYSAENPNQFMRPVLEVDWSVPPPAPVNLVPAGGGVVSLTKPTLSFEGGIDDPSAEPTQASLQVQISTTSDFSAPGFDSGTVATTLSELDLSTTAYSGVPAGATRYWRARFTDSAGQTSEWSDPETFQRVAKGSLAITSPTAGGTVAETTPTVSFALTGATQEAVEVVLYEIDDGVPVELWEFPKQVTTATDIVLFGGPDVELGLQSGKDYRVVVHAWDDAERQTTPGDPDYYEASADFTYVRAGTVTAVPTLTATVPVDPDTGDPQPGVVLRWTYPSPPAGFTGFTVRVDGVEAIDNIDPATVLVSGTVYSMTYYGAVDGVESDYEVEAIVQPSSGTYAGKRVHSTGNRIKPATGIVRGKWLVDPDPKAPLFLRIAMREQVDLQIGESATTYYPVGSRKPVRVTDAVRGYEGSASGLLLSQNARDKLLEFKGRMKRYRYVQSDLNIPVRLEEVSTSPASDHIGYYYQCAVSFYQVGEFFEVRGLAGK